MGWFGSRVKKGCKDLRSKHKLSPKVKQYEFTDPKSKDNLNLEQPKPININFSQPCGERVRGGDMGKGAAKRKRQRRVKGSDMGKRKRYSSSPPVSDSDSDSDEQTATVRMRGLTSSDSEPTAAVRMRGLTSSDSEPTATVRMRGLTSSDSEPTAIVRMRGLTSSDSDVAPATNEMKGWYSSDSDDVSPPRKRAESVGCSTNHAKQPGVSEDELSGQLLSDLEKVQYFGTTASGGDEQALQRTKSLSHSAFPNMKQSGCKEGDVKKLVEIFELQGNEAMQSKLYPAAIGYYNVAIALGGDTAIYYCNRAAAYIQTCQYAEAILDCQKSIAIDPNYIKAYTRLGYIYFVQGIDALEKGHRIATLLDPTNEFARENARAAEHIIWQQREESGQTSNWSNSNGVTSVTDQVPSPLFGKNSGTELRSSAMSISDTNPGELYAAMIADISFLVALRQKTNNSNGN